MYALTPELFICCCLHCTFLSCKGWWRHSMIQILLLAPSWYSMSHILWQGTRSELSKSTSWKWILAKFTSCFPVPTYVKKISVSHLKWLFIIIWGLIFEIHVFSRQWNNISILTIFKPRLFSKSVHYLTKYKIAQWFWDLL